MIIQAILDFFRDIVVNWITGLGGIANDVGAEAAGAALGGVAAQSGHFLALFISPSVWPFIVAAWAVFFSTWLSTALIAMFARRGASA